ncbi:MAG: aldose epimerase family protein [Eubacteriales bacterium]|nr:aldose epimerase family protein [Eubacteriales bacterium]
MKEFFGNLPSGESTFLYTISCGGLSAAVSDYGATLVRLFVPDKNGVLADVVLGHDDCNGYRMGDACLGATVGRNANRLKNACFILGNKTYALTPNENGNNLHSGPEYYFKRLWRVLSHRENAITLALNSPHGDQGFPGNAVIHVTYTLEPCGNLRISYDAVCDRDTVFNLTNHSYFNLAGHEKTGAAMDQLLILPGRFFNPDDRENIPTGELRSVSGTPMDFRSPKPIGRDIGQDYEPLRLQGGYDHNWEVFCNPCAILSDPVSGRSMAVSTDCPGIQLYAGNFLDERGKGGIYYGKRSGVALETQYYPDCLHHEDWPQPITKAGEKYHSETVYRFF